MKTLFFTGIFIFHFSMSFVLQASELGFIPRVWHVLPETMNTLNQTPESEESLNKVSRTLVKVMDTNEEILSGLDIKKSPGWHLSAFETNLIVSGSGLIGISAVRGDCTVRLIWFKKPPSVPKLQEDDFMNEGDGNEKAIVLRPFATDADLKSELEPAIAGVQAGGRVKNVPALRRNLFQLAKEIQVLVDQASDKNLPETPWFVSKIRMDLIADASGNVTPFTGVGSDVRFWLEWSLLQHKPAPPAPRANPNPQKAMNPPTFIQKFLHNMATDVSLLATTASPPGPGQFVVDNFQVGVGLGAGGKIFVAKVSGRVAARVIFRKKSAPVIPKNFPGDKLMEMDDDSYLVEESDMAAHREFAEVNRIAYEKGLGTIIYKIPRSKFRQGLVRAKHIANFFVRHAQNRSKRPWQIGQIDTLFDLSVTGALGLASITGVANSEIHFRKIY